MFERVLVPVDFSPTSRAAVFAVREIPGVREIILLHVVYNRYPSKDPSYIHPSVEEARSGLEEIKRGLDLPGTEITTLVEEITGGEISEIILRASARLGVSLIIMGRRGAGIIETLLLGSVASDVLRYGKTDLLLIPTPFRSRQEPPETEIHRPALFSHVMICTDFSDPDIGSVCLENFPQIQRASLFHSVTTGNDEHEIRSAIVEAEAGLGKIRDMFARDGIPSRIHVAVGSAAEEILAFSRGEDVSLILLKSVGRKSFLNVLVGSTSAPVARNAVKPVLVLKKCPAVST